MNVILIWSFLFDAGVSSDLDIPGTVQH